MKKNDIHQQNAIIGADELILITGANGFIGSRLVQALLRRGFRNLRCFVRPSGKLERLNEMIDSNPDAKIELYRGNLLSKQDCTTAMEGVKLVFHLAAGRGEKSVPDAYLNSVVTTRNVLDAAASYKLIERFVNVSSFAVYTNRNKKDPDVLDESCPVESRPDLRGDAYSYAKVKQDELIAEYGAKYGLRYVIVRPGYVIGPGKTAISGRVGIDTFGVFLHFGGGNKIPFTYVENCADAIALAGLKMGVDGEVFNIVDDDLPSSSRFLRLYKKRVKSFRSVYLPHAISYLFCYLWEKYATKSDGQLPPVFNRKRWYNNWKKTTYSNAKLKEMLGWQPRVSMADALARYFEGCRSLSGHA